MSPPRHLWSGSWRQDSAAAAEELAKRRARPDEPTEVPVERPAPTPKRSAAARLAIWLRGVRLPGVRPRGVRLPGVRPRVALLAVLAGLLTAGVAFGAVSLFGGAGDTGPSGAGGRPTWLGVDMVSLPFSGWSFGSGGGAVVTQVTPGSPAAVAGLQPGDVITQIDNQPIGSPSDVESAIAGTRPGDQVQIQYERGLVPFTTQATLQARPTGYP